MTVPDFETLMVPITRDEALASELDVAEQLGLPVTAWQPLSVARELLYINAQLVANQSVSLTPIARGGLLEYASGVWLSLLAQQVYDTTRIESTFATGPILLDNSLGTPHTFAAGDVRVLNESTGKTYTSTSGGTLAAFGDLELDFAADEPGSASNLTVGQSLSLVVSIPGVTATYVQALVGQNEETDQQLRARCREANAKASPNGPADAYNYYAKTALDDDGNPVGITRTNVTEGNGTVTVYVADADGAATAGQVEDVQETSALYVTPTGFTATVTAATPVSIDIVGAVVLSPGVTATESELTTLVTDALSEYLSTVDVGGVEDASFRGIYHDTLITIARVAMGDNALSITIATPAANVDLDADEVPVLGTVTLTYST